MKILQVNEHYAPVGGAERYLCDVSTQLEKRGCQVSVVYAIATPNDHHVAGRAETHVPELLVHPGSKGTERFRRIQQLAREIAPDVIQIHNLDDPDVLAVMAEICPTIQFVHSHSARFCPGDGKFYHRGHHTCRRPVGPYCLVAPYIHQCGSLRPWRIASNYARVKRWLEVAPRLARLIVASHYMKRELTAVGLSPDRVEVNPIGIQADDEPAGMPCESRDEPLVLFVGRLYAAKGPQYLLRALQHVDIPCRAVFVGDGPERRRLEQDAKTLPSHHIIKFTGWIESDRLRGLYREARVVVIPSVWPEPFGMVGIEAFEQAKPVVAFDVGGISEWLEDGQTGLLVQPKDVLSLGAALKRILSDPELAFELGRRGRAAVHDRFNVERHTDRLLQIYQEVLDSSPPGVSRFIEPPKPTPAPFV